MPNYFLAKTDPETYSITDFARDGQTIWDGVHNFQAIAVIKKWQEGDFVLIYHSQGEGRVVGLARVISNPRENLNDSRPSWVADLEFVREFGEEQKVTLKEIKASGIFPHFLLVTHSRLSVMPCPVEFVEWLEVKGLELR